MLELLVSLRRRRGEGEVGGAEKPDKKVGDIICAKISPAVWSELEHLNFLIVKYVDSELETKVHANDGVVSLPFAKYDKDKLITRSELKVDVPAFAQQNSLDLEEKKSKQTIYRLYKEGMKHWPI